MSTIFHACKGPLHSYFFLNLKHVFRMDLMSATNTTYIFSSVKQPELFFIPSCNHTPTAQIVICPSQLLPAPATIAHRKHHHQINCTTHFTIPTMSYTPPVWDFNNTYGYLEYFLQPPRPENITSNMTLPQYTSGWSPFGYDIVSPTTFNYDMNPMSHFVNRNNPEEEMSEGIRALMEMTRNFKNQSKFEGITYTRSQDSVAEPIANVHQMPPPDYHYHKRIQFQPESPKFRIAGLPSAANPPSSSASTAVKNNNYAMAVKKTLEPRNMANVIYRQQTPPQTPTPTPPTLMAQSLEPKTWFDKNGRRTVNAKEMEGGPKINGRSIVNGIILKSLKFVKPARQCPKWDKSKHRIEEPNCPLWHPRERCQYYPKCRLTAEVCGFGHPFCGEVCHCALDKRSLQLNHLKYKDADAAGRT